MASSQPTGRGDIEVRKFVNYTTISTLSSGYPLRLLPLPTRPQFRAALIFTLTYGGGIVAGDRVDLRVIIRPGAHLALLTQGSTKIYKTPSTELRSAQDLTVSVEPGAALVLLPDPIQPFKGSAYEQRQVYHIDPADSNLLALDWVSEGRTALGEKWDFWEWKGRNEVWSLQPESDDGQPFKKGRLLVRDNIRLGSNDQDPREEMYNLGVFGTIIVKGPLFRGVAKTFLEEFSHLPRIGTNTRQVAQPSDRKTDTKPSLTWTAASIRGFVIVKFGAKEANEVKRWLRGLLQKEGTVAKEFGEHSMMCLR
jgi:urease accessory protein